MSERAATKRVDLHLKTTSSYLKAFFTHTRIYLERSKGSIIPHKQENKTATSTTVGTKSNDALRASRRNSPSSCLSGARRMSVHSSPSTRALATVVASSFHEVRLATVLAGQRRFLSVALTLVLVTYSFHFLLPSVLSIHHHFVLLLIRFPNHRQSATRVAFRRRPRNKTSTTVLPSNT